jgi:ferredoxin-NADP reductase
MAEPTQDASIVRVCDLTPRVREMVLLPSAQTISFVPGQWISLKLPVGERPPLNRAYTMADQEAPSGELVLTFDRVHGGLGSEYLYSLQAGDRVTLSGPYGNFVLPDPLTKDVVMIARYTGVVPFRCMLKQIMAHPLSRSITLIVVSDRLSELPYHEEFLDLASRVPTFRYESLLPVIPAVPRQDAEVQSTLDLWIALFRNRRDVMPMICGTKAFVRPVREQLQKLGFGRRDVRVETYD